jgi:hypothetical protein
VALLLGEAAPVGDIADALLRALAAEVVLYQRRVLEMPLQRLRTAG